MTARTETIPADLFFAKAAAGLRFRAWPTDHESVTAGLILTATSGTQSDVGDTYVPFTHAKTYQRQTCTDGAIWRSAANRMRFELVGPDAVDVCGCGQHGRWHPDPYLLADGLREAAEARPMLLCPTCWIRVGDLANAD